MRNSTKAGFYLSCRVPHSRACGTATYASLHRRGDSHACLRRLLDLRWSGRHFNFGRDRGPVRPAPFAKVFHSRSPDRSLATFLLVWNAAFTIIFLASLQTNLCLAIVFFGVIVGGECHALHGTGTRALSRPSSQSGASPGCIYSLGTSLKRQEIGRASCRERGS